MSRTAVVDGQDEVVNVIALDKVSFLDAARGA